MMHKCESCDLEREESQIKPLEEVEDLLSRLTPGGVVPSGECVICGAFVYPVPNRRMRMYVGVEITVEYPEGTPEPLDELADLVSSNMDYEMTFEHKGIKITETEIVLSESRGELPGDY